MKTASEFSPFLLPRTTASMKCFAPIVESITGLKKLHKHYLTRPQNADTNTFLTHTLDSLGIRFHSSGEPLEGIPKTGPLLIVANHPLGGVEGVILAKMLMQYRPDIQVMANLFLKRIPELDNLFIGVDVFETKEARRTNMKAIKEAGQHLTTGGALLIFPAGEVSTFDDQTHHLQDKEWGRLVGRLARSSKASCLPIFIEGQNSPLFYKAGNIHPRLRTVLLGRELLNKKNKSIGIRCGSIIEPHEISKMDNDQDITNYLRLNTYLLEQTQPVHQKDLTKEAKEIPAPSRPLAPILEEVASAELEKAIHALPSDHLLIQQKQFSVFIAEATEIPCILKQIGIIRERNFREVGEGTGREIDLDQFDDHYLHLFIWDKEQKNIVGAYRLGLVDDLTQKSGIQGLYSRTLFKFDENFIKTQPNAIEMGRSVIDKPYQKSLSPLMLLWKGIATFVSRNPQYKTLFGPVSISGEYKALTHQLIVSCLTAHFYDADRSKLVEATHPVPLASKPFWSVNLLSGLADIQLLSNIVSRLENGAGVPVLIRQYLSLQGRFISFNVDPDFNQTVDGLITVDLTQLTPRVLGKYMGKEQAEYYLDFHHQKMETQLPDPQEEK
ncbi:lysophospholipid acyltransferase family protein [Marinomonas sp. 15G1-11]|uniref:L-ornithine N(alpha)-acyltransferase n=1 Tax=Marinomonas phaeophyticola TaxID=3004091 RepID=A0ABT4JS14_9GAMM|nr:lysophospholipid acyltransferase family protein [Marinomonas sp. 15G1-11]MCZ2721182.1 lysophospholipid acyltransferase family protein [Marinomonas sp. 15G1-11]